jgi:hypothetical protein
MGNCFQPLPAILKPRLPVLPKKHNVVGIRAFGIIVNTPAIGSLGGEFLVNAERAHGISKK